MSETMDVVDENNRVISQAPQEEIYAKKLNHRIVHIFVIHPSKKEVYFQKRSEQKSFLPGYYCTSAGGHVQAGESYPNAAKRELQEELGLTTPLTEAGTMIFVSDQHKRFIYLFVTYAQDGFRFTDGEVAGGEFIPIDDAYAMVMKDKKIHPQLQYCYRWLYEQKSELLQR